MSKLLKRSRRPLRPVHLPSEIISNVLDSLLLDDIVRASHVSRIWRSAAREHRTYCRHITYDAGSDRDRLTGRLNESNLQFFLSRLSARPQGKIDSLSISLRNTVSSWGCETDHWQIFIPALRACLHRVVQLCISISIDDRRVPALLAALMVPAPELTFLSLHGESGPGHIVPTLPVGLFSGHAPKLDVLDVNLRLPTTPIPAFASVKVVNHDTSQDAMPAERFFIHCPRLEELHIDCNSEPIGDAFLAACPPRLRKLSVTSASTDTDTELIVRAFSHAGLEHFRAYAPAVNGATFALLLSHLANSNSTSPDGKLQLDILYDRADIFWEFSDYDAARARCFVFWHSIPEPDMDSEDDSIAELDSEYAAHCATIAHRIVRLAIAYNIHTWQFLLSIFPEATVTLSGITTLSLVLSSTTSSSKFLDLVCLPVGRRHGGMRPLPSLRLIELVAVDEVRVRVEWEVGALAHFIGNVLGRVARRELEMQLKGVVIVGDLGRVWGYFRSITIVPCE